jgi:hypothetical protein
MAPGVSRRELGPLPLLRSQHRQNGFESRAVEAADHLGRAVSLVSDLTADPDHEILCRDGRRPGIASDGSSEVVEVHDLFDDPGLQVLVEAHADGALRHDDSSILRLVGQPLGERGEPCAERSDNCILAVGRDSRAPFANLTMLLRVRRLDEMNEVRNRGIDVLTALSRFAVEILVDDPHTAAGKVAGKTADELILQDGGLRPGIPHRVVADGVAHDMGGFEKELTHSLG